MNQNSDHDKKEDGDKLDDKRYNRRKSFSSDDSYDSLNNTLGRKHSSNVSEFKIHFFVRKVPMNGMSDSEFLSFIRKKINLAGQPDVVQINSNGSFCDIAIGMRKDDDAKLVYLGKKHFNFGKSKIFQMNFIILLGRQKEVIELSDAFKNYLENKKLLERDNLERYLRRNQISRGRSDSSDSYRSRSLSRKAKKRSSQQRRRSSRSLSSPDRQRKTQTRKKSKSPSLSDRNIIYIFAIPQEFTQEQIIQEIVSVYKQKPPQIAKWSNHEKMSYLELGFSDESACTELIKAGFSCQGVPLLVIPKKKRPLKELLRSYQVQVDLDKDVDPYGMVQEFKKYGELIGIYTFQTHRRYFFNKNSKILIFFLNLHSYLLLYASSIQDTLRPPRQLNFGDVVSTVKIIDQAIDIQRPQLKETLAYQLKQQEDDDAGIQQSYYFQSQLFQKKIEQIDVLEKIESDIAQLYINFLMLIEKDFFIKPAKLYKYLKAEKQQVACFLQTKDITKIECSYITLQLSYQKKSNPPLPQVLKITNKSKQQPSSGRLISCQTTQNLFNKESVPYIARIATHKQSIDPKYQIQQRALGTPRLPNFKLQMINQQRYNH